MTNNNNTRNIINEITNTMQYLGDDYTLTEMECDPGDSAIRITKQNSKKTLYIIAYNNPDDTETRLYDEHNNLTTQCSFYNGTFNTTPPETIATLISKSL